MAGYSEFRIRIEPGARKGQYRVEASGLGGAGTGVFKVPFRETELENFVLKVGRTRRGVRRIASPEWDLAKTFGGQLFTSLMQGAVGELYRSSFSAAQASGDGVRVTLSLTDVPELAEIPWEYLFDPPNFLAISTSTPIVRYLDVAKPRRPLEVALPIRILAVISAPSDAEQLDSTDERGRLESALKPLIDAGAVSIDWLEEATLLALTKKFRADTYHILHFVGHGGFDDASGEGALLFEDEDGRGRPVSGEQLATVLNNKESLRLVFLNSCEGARTSIKDPFSGVAASLIQREIPAVIAMQFEITDRAAIIFAGEFYAMLAEGQPVDTAVTHARLTVFADQNDVEWGTPVLFMRVADGQLFDVADAAALPRVTEEALPPKAPTSPATAGPTPGVAALGAAAIATDASPASGGVVPPPASGPAVPVASTVAPPAAPVPEATPEPTGGSSTPVPPAVVPGTPGPTDVPDTPPVVVPTPTPTPGVLSRIPWAIVAVGAVVLVIAVLLLRLLLPPSTTGSVKVSTVGASQTGQITVSGSDFAPGESIDVSLDGAVVETVTTGANGTFTTQIGIGSKTGGVVSVVGGTSGYQASTSFSVAPSVSSSPSSSPEVSPTASSPASPSASAPTGSTSPGILFYSDRSPGSAKPADNELYLLDPVTRVVTRLTANANADSFPTWSPNHDQIVFDQDGDLVIVPFVNGKLGDLESLTTNPSLNDFFPAWSRDDWIAFVRTRSGTTGSEIRKVKPGSPSQLVVSGPLVRAPAWSPDGTTLAYMSDNGSGQFDIFTVKEGEEPVPLLDDPTLSELNPNWSPDGKTIVFVRDHGEPKSFDNDIYTVDVATKTVSEPLTGTGADHGEGLQDGNPVWSPDGSQIAFYRATDSSASPGYHLWLMNADGSGQEDMMPDRPGRNLDPMWR